MVHQSLTDAVAPPSDQLLNSQLFRDRRNRHGATQKTAAPTAEQVKENHQLPATLEDSQHLFDTLGRGRLGVLLLTFR